MPQFDDILKKIEQSVNRFNRRIPAAQKGMMQAIEEDLRGLDVNNGNVKATVKNLSLIARIKNRMTSILLTDEYKDEVKEFAKSFNEVTALQNQYWKSIESTFKPRPLLDAIKKDAITDTVNKLTEAGIGVNISDKVSDILRTNITTGGSYSSLTDELRQYLTTTNTPGGLEKYAKQITTDALNQYNATYTQTVSSDLNFEWFKYSNTDIETTRPFCDAMTDQPYFHISEIPALLRAEGLTYVNKKGDRVPVPIYSKTGLPHGMIPGTDASNFQIRRGGYNCGHQVRPISASLVPDDVKSRVMATPAYIRWAAQQRKDNKIEVIEEPPQVVAEPQPVTTKSIRKQMVEKNAAALGTLDAVGFKLHKELFDHLPQANIKIVYDPKSSGSYFQPATKTVVIGGSKARVQSEIYREKVVAHEIGHAIHHENNIITNTSVREDFQQMYGGLQKLFKGKGSEIQDALTAEAKKLSSVKGNWGAVSESYSVVMDVLGSITRGAYGGGHTKKYYKSGNYSQKEIFAHAVQMSRDENILANAHPLMKEATDKMNEYILKVLESVKNQR